ncbi:MAG: pyruvate kinase alpha/beta domain-containing protein [Evtepia sp.]
MTDAAGQISVSDATAHAACLTAKDVNASAIVTVSESGNTARLLSKYRPAQPIIACVMDEQVQRQLSISWGITPLMMDLATSTDELIEGAVSAPRRRRDSSTTGRSPWSPPGSPQASPGPPTRLKVHLVGSSLINGAGVGDENVKGILCVCRTLEDVRHKFHPGMILVVPHTNNEMPPCARQAVGVITTEENGLGSHAAVVGLSLNKAVIVGAIGATRTLHDGMKAFDGLPPGIGAELGGVKRRRKRES